MSVKLACLALALVGVACDGPPSPPDRPVGAPRSSTRPAPSVASVERRVRPSPPGEETLDFEGPFGPMPTVVLIPQGAPEARHPVLVAFHGRGEALKPPARGARGWVDDYDLLDTIRRLHAPPLSTADFHGMVSADHLADINAGLQEHPFDDLIIVCPYLPDILRGAAAFRQARPLADFVADEILHKVHASTPSSGIAGIDGVSLGGRAALLIGLTRPDAFVSVGALQAAVDPTETPRIVALARAAKERRPDLTLRLLTSDQDYFLGPVRSLAGALRDARIDVELDVVTGTHSYAFNQGPGGYEMLLHHARRLARRRGGTGGAPSLTPSGRARPRAP